MKEKLNRPSDDLPPEQLQEAWSKFLDQEVGGSGNSPKLERLAGDTGALELLAQYQGIPEDYMKMPLSPKVLLYIEALKRALGRLPVIQRDIIKRYYGIEWPEQQTQVRIAAEVVGQSNQKIGRTMVDKYLRTGRKNLERLVREEMAKLAKESVQGGSSN